MAGIFITPSAVERLCEILCLKPDEITTYDGCLNDRALDGIAEAFKDQGKMVSMQQRVTDLRQTLLDFALDD